MNNIIMIYTVMVGSSNLAIVHEDSGVHIKKATNT